MTTITDKTVEPLNLITQIFADLDLFTEFCSLVRNDLMGLNEHAIPVKKMAKKFGLEDPSDLQDSIDAVQYLILHIAKVKANEQEFL